MMNREDVKANAGKIIFVKQRQSSQYWIGMCVCVCTSEYNGKDTEGVVLEVSVNHRLPPIEIMIPFDCVDSFGVLEDE